MREPPSSRCQGIICPPISLCFICTWLRLSVCLSSSEWACLVPPLLDTSMRKMSVFVLLCLKDKCWIIIYQSIHPSIHSSSAARLKWPPVNDPLSGNTHSPKQTVLCAWLTKKHSLLPLASLLTQHCTHSLGKKPWTAAMANETKRPNTMKVCNWSTVKQPLWPHDKISQHKSSVSGCICV